MASLQDFEPLKPAERRLLDIAVLGKQCSFARSRPDAATEANEIRADFLRFLALGGEGRSSVHESGLRIQGAYISGALNLDGATKIGPLWIQDCTLAGEFSFSDAETKVVSLDGTAVSSIRGDGVSVDGSLLLRRTIIDGSLQLFGAEITGTLSCVGCVIEGKRWRSQRLAADLATVTVSGNVELRNGFRANGLIQLDNSEIGGTFDCSQATFLSGYDEARSEHANRFDPAIRAIKGHRLNLKGSLYLRDCDCEGELSFSGAQIGGDLDCRNGTFRYADNAPGDGTSLRFTRIEVGGNVYLAEGFNARGKVQLNGAVVRGNMDCRGGAFLAPEGNATPDLAAGSEPISDDALSLVNTQIRGALIIGSLEKRNGSAAIFHGSLDLKSAHVRVLVDGEDAWPKSSKRARGAPRHVIHLDGFTYERLAGVAPIEANLRMDWLRCQPRAHLGSDFKPQPFEQLIKVLRNMGHPEEARRLAVERQGFLIRRRLSQWRDGPLGAVRAVSALISALTVGLLIGHGYRPLRVLFIMAIVGIAFGYYFKLAGKRGVFAPRDAQVFLQSDFNDCRPHSGGNWTTCADKVGAKFAEYPQFNPWVYSFNVLLPVVDLYQEKNWVPMQKEVPIDFGGGRLLIVPGWGTNALVLAELVFGWVASLLAIAAFSGLVKTD